MARNKTETALPVEVVIDEMELGKAVATLDAAAAGQMAVLDAFDVAKALGRIEAANFFTTVGDKLIAETAINIRQSKKYKGFPYKDSDGNIRQVGDFAEFCQVFLGKSYSRTMELIGTYNLLGPELYEKAEALGFRQRDYNAMKALPADDRKLIADAIEEESFDRAMEIIEEMAARNQRQKEAADKQLKQQNDLLIAKDTVLHEKQQLLNKKSEQLALLENANRQAVDIKFMPGHLQMEALSSFTVRIVSEIEASLRSHIVKMYGEFDATPKHIELAAAQSLGLIITAAYGVCEDLLISPVLDSDKAAENPALQDARDFEAWQAEHDRSMDSVHEAIEHASAGKPDWQQWAEGMPANSADEDDLVAQSVSGFLED